MKQSDQGYHYTESGLQNVWIHGLHTEDDAGEEVIVLPRIRELHQLISDGIVNARHSIAGEELRFLRTEMGLTQSELAQLLHRRRITVARWETGGTDIPAVVDAYIRLLAMEKLGLEKQPPDEIITWCAGSTHVEPVSIDASGEKYSYSTAA